MLDKAWHSGSVGNGNGVVSAVKPSLRAHKRVCTLTNMFDTRSSALHTLLVGTTVLLTLAPLNAIAEPIPSVAGYLEKVWLGDDEIAFEAKLDTGANSSSLNAARSETFKKGNQLWVRINLTNRWNQSYQFELPVKKTVRIRRAGTKIERRNVIDLELCVGGQTAITEFSLADRTGQSYQVLVGRKFMRGRILVDSGKKFVASKGCGKKDNS